jgi:FHA domain-containing protein/von Willebrand factor type A domain-containing protein
MRKHALALSALALVALASGAARAADKLRLERMDLKASPTLKLYLTYVDADGRAITGRAKEDFKIVVDSAEQGTASALQTFDETKDPINVVVVAQLGSAMNSVIEDEKRAIAALADSLPPKSKMALLGYAGDTKYLAELGSPVDAESAAKTMSIDADSPEMHMMSAVRSALDKLGAAPKGERKLMVIFSDGIDVDMDARTFASIGKRAQDAGVVIDTIGLNDFDPGKLRNLGILAKQSTGMERICKSAGDVSNHFNNVSDEIKKQYVATFEVPLAGGDGKDHVFQSTATNNGREQFSTTLTDKLPKPTHLVVKKGETGTRWWLWVLIGLVAVGLVGLIAWLIFREKPEEMPEEQPVAAPVMAAAPAGPMKTMALNVNVSGGAPAVGWIVATSGKHADQTFKLKPARTLIGTGGDCDVKVEDQFMSSHHCEVRFQGGSFKLFDLGSTNGIVVNDKKVAEHELVDNDQFRLGRTEFKFKSIT